MRQYRERWVAGAFIQQTDTNAPSSLTGLNVSSQLAVLDAASLANLTPSSFTGAAGWRGISELNSGVVTTSVQASAARSGAVIILTPYNYNVIADSFNGIQVSSVGAGFFNVLCARSIAPTSLMPFAWMVVR